MSAHAWQVDLLASIEPERWLPVVGFPGYEVSDLGRVRSYLNHGGRRAEPKILKPLFVRGYPRYNLVPRGGVAKACQAHVLVLEAFVGPRPAGFHGCHNDGDSMNPRLDNLRWDSPSANEADKVVHGRSMRGERHHQAVLCAARVKLVRLLRVLGASPYDIAEWFGVSYYQVYSICKHKSWRHL